MDIKKSKIFGNSIILYAPKKHDDPRGYFEETFNKILLSEKLNISFDVIQENHSFSKKGVLRGLHAQISPDEQAKIVSVKKGLIQDVVLDIRKGSETFGMFETYTLSGENNNQLYISEGFAHGFLTCSDEADIYYKVNAKYNPDSEVTIKFDDPELKINWKEKVISISEKDRHGISLSEYVNRFHLV